ncbi:MAG: hypothetical protein GC180_03955 [Bacteroidetes bacterium]|nr:hypothetical protein [Bacteroidota bacterium]
MNESRTNFDILFLYLPEKWETCFEYDGFKKAKLTLLRTPRNNNTLYKTLPVTIGYSQIFASVVKQMPGNKDIKAFIPVITISMRSKNVRAENGQRIAWLNTGLDR